MNPRVEIPAMMVIAFPPNWKLWLSGRQQVGGLLLSRSAGCTGIDLRRDIPQRREQATVSITLHERNFPFVAKRV